jgi:L-arabinose isomerase
MTIRPARSEVWLVTGSQHLYGPGPLAQVGANARAVAKALSAARPVPYPVVFKPVVTSADAVRAVCQEADQAPQCAGLVLWMHTFSPARMWIGGLSALRKPFAHLHTQFNRDLPWGTIDMDFMNLNQAAHGDREAGFLHARMRLPRKVVVGHWEDPEVQERLGAWMRVARGWQDMQGARIARLGDNMRRVAVTEGDKVAAEERFGFAVDGHGVGDLAAEVAAVPRGAVTRLCAEYVESYSVAAQLRRGGARHESLREAARIELGLRAFLVKGGFKGFTTTFEDLHGLRQLPGIAVQRLMAEGYGFGAEGDWKTAALVRLMKVIGSGLGGGTSFMEDYTYHLHPSGSLVLGAHMLEICPSIASGRPSLEVHPLGIGAREDPVRLVFGAPAGPALNASLIDLGDRFRLVANEVDVVEPPGPMPRLPVARAVWRCRPDFKTACGAWIRSGGAHHTAFSYAVTSEHLRDLAEIAGVELVLIDADTRLAGLEKELRWNESYYQPPRGGRI